MNGRDLTLGALAGLAVAGLVAQRRGSRDESLAALTREVRADIERLALRVQRRALHAVQERGSAAAGRRDPQGRKSAPAPTAVRGCAPTASTARPG